MPPAEHSPFTIGEVERLFAPIAASSGLLIAVSGGSDSLALLDLIAMWRRESAIALKVAAATVDHGLRPQSDEEAREVQRRCTAYTIAHRILRWEGVKPESGLPAAAREARYALMSAELARLGFAQIVTAHTLEDQAETVLMRLMRGSGLHGLGGMRFLSKLDGVMIARPLLAVRRGRLQAHLRAQGIGWFNDPSNDDQAYLRPRLRRLMPLLAQEGLSADRLVEVAHKLQRADAAIERMVESLLAQRGRDGRMERQTYCNAAQEVRLRCLARWISEVGGVGVPAPLAALERVDTALCDVTCVKHRQTLGFALISAGPRYLRLVKEGPRQPR